MTSCGFSMLETCCELLCRNWGIFLQCILKQLIMITHKLTGIQSGQNMMEKYLSIKRLVSFEGWSGQDCASVAFEIECWTQWGDLLTPDSLTVLHPCSRGHCNCIPRVLHYPNLWGRPPSPTADTGHQHCRRKHRQRWQHAAHQGALQHCSSQGSWQDWSADTAGLPADGSRHGAGTECSKDPGTGTSSRNILLIALQTRRTRNTRKEMIIY